MKNIYMLPTDKPSRLYYSCHAKNYHLLREPKKNEHYRPTQNIYITSDEEIKEGDWVKLFVKHIDKEWIHKITKEDLLLYTDFNNEASKIILTTDQDLIKDGVQAIDDEFLKWFVENPSCEEVEVRQKPKVNAVVKGLGIKSFNNGYRIVIPKSKLASKLKEILDNMSQEEFDEEWKKVTDLKLEGPSIIQHVALPKQEPQKMELNAEVAEYLGFVKGVEWQMERSHSDKEVLELLLKMNEWPTTFDGEEDIKEWFKLFKNKLYNITK